MSDTFDLTQHGITVTRVLRNPAVSRLYEQGLVAETGTAITNTGSMVALSGEKTGRTPSDKRIVREASSENDVWWGPVNIELERESFVIS